ncbi:MAG: methyltransferase domain-containing protein [Nanoarchaeota archaeon]|mgnify:FL=1
MGISYFDKVAWIYPLVDFFGVKTKFYRSIKKSCGLNKDDIVLDVGGGTGIIAKMLINEVKEITVLDQSKNMLSKIHSDKIKKVLGSAENLNFKDKSFDLIYLVDSFHHFTNGYNKEEYNKVIDKCIKELLRTLKNNGRLLFIEFDNTSSIGKKIEFFENRIMKWNSNFYSPKGLVNVLKKYKVKTEVYKINNYCYAVKVIKK